MLYKNIPNSWVIWEKILWEKSESYDCGPLFDENHKNLRKFKGQRPLRTRGAKNIWDVDISRLRFMAFKRLFSFSFSREPLERIIRNWLTKIK